MKSLKQSALSAVRGVGSSRVCFVGWVVDVGDGAGLPGKGGRPRCRLGETSA